jgi:hypothetical protein
MNKIVSQCREHKRITSILICCLALWNHHFSHNLLNIELEKPIRYMRRGNRLIGGLQ